VPIEEYTFFVLQPILAGLWLGFLARRWHVEDQSFPASPPSRMGNALRLWSVIILSALWLGAMIILISGWRPGVYLALELGWALPPIALQLFFGADILWRYRKLVLWTLAPMTLYLSAADFLAIGWGTWTIDPEQSLHILLGGVLPLEEFVFFLLTNTLLTFGIVLITAGPSHDRLAAIRQRLSVFAQPAEQKR
jgi:lycopene cyclase domain-containing protein